MGIEQGRGRRRLRARRLASVWVAVSAVFLLASTAVAAEPVVDRVAGQTVYDTAGLLRPGTEATAGNLAEAIGRSVDADVIVYTQRHSSVFTASDTEANAQAIVDHWRLGAGHPGGSLVLLVTIEGPECDSEMLVYPDDAFAARVPLSGKQDFFNGDLNALIDNCDYDAAVLAALGRLAGEAIGTAPAPGSSFFPAGPPFPPPIEGQRIYDNRRIFSPAAVAEAERTSHSIEDRSGAQVVVYTQSVSAGLGEDEARAQAAALGNQWGVGRNGFNDGVVVLFDIDPSGIHGKVAIVGGDGFRSAYLPDREAQRIVDQQVIPRLTQSPPQFDLALHDALAQLDAAVSPDHVQALSRARILNAIIAIVVAPLAFALLVGAAVLRWIRYGKDPVYLDDPSILMPAPPPQLTAADAAVIVEGRTSRRALTTALLDLASRGRLSFQDSRSGLLGSKREIGILTNPPKEDPTTEAHRALNDRRPIGPAEEVVLRNLRDLASEGYIAPKEVLEFGSSVKAFDKAVEQQVVAGGWYAAEPSEAIGRTRTRGVAEVVLGGFIAYLGVQVPSSGALVLGLAILGAGFVTFAVARVMPTVTMPGAVVRAMLAAYRRTLDKTMAQARSMQQVVDEAKLTWLETPDQAVVWGTALGLNAAIEAVLARSLEDVKSKAVPATAAWFPVWFGSPGEATTGAPGGSIFSGSAIPDFGGMFNTLGTIGNTPGSSGGGGFGGGGGFSGGGGGSGSF